MSDFKEWNLFNELFTEIIHTREDRSPNLKFNKLKAVKKNEVYLKLWNSLAQKKKNEKNHEHCLWFALITKTNATGSNVSVKNALIEMGNTVFKLLTPFMKTCMYFWYPDCLYLKNSFMVKQVRVCDKTAVKFY